MAYPYQLPLSVVPLPGRADVERMPAPPRPEDLSGDYGFGDLWAGQYSAPPGGDRVAAPGAGTRARPGGALNFTPGQAPAPAPPPERDWGHVYVDTSRGEAGEDWLRSHLQSGAADPMAMATPGGTYTSARGTLADLEGRARTRALLEAAYGELQPFDPLRAQIEAAQGEAALKVAKAQAEDPFGTAERLAGIPERARGAARREHAASIFDAIGGYTDEKTGKRVTWPERLAQLESEREQLHQHPLYKNATKEEQAKQDAALAAEIARIKGTMLLMQRSMAFGTSETPSTLFRDDVY